MELEHTIKVPLSDLIIVKTSDGDYLNPRGAITDSVWMQNSLAETGQLDPIVVLPTTNGLFYLLDGHTRVTAARTMGWDSLRAVYPIWYDGQPIESLNTDRLLLDMLATNVRRNVPYSKQGKAFIKLITSEYITVERLAATMGMDVPVVQDYINLAAAPETIQRRVDSGDMPWTAFKEWRKKSEKVKQAIAESNDPKDFSVRGLRAKAYEVRTGEPKTEKLSVIEEVVASNQDNPLVAALKTAAMGIIANWYDLSPADQEEVLYTVANLNELMEQN